MLPKLIVVDRIIDPPWQKITGASDAVVITGAGGVGLIKT